jgi:hypothetical protein
MRNALLVGAAIVLMMTNAPLAHASQWLLWSRTDSGRFWEIQVFPDKASCKKAAVYWKVESTLPANDVLTTLQHSLMVGKKLNCKPYQG